MALQISASLIKDYLDCQMKAYYRIHKKDLGEKNIYAIRGSAVHEIIAKIKEKDLNILIDEVTVKYNLSNEDKIIVLDYIKKFNEEFFPIIANANIDYYERFFKLKIYKDIYLVGIIDRIVDNNIIDWKTASKAPKSIDKDIQFIIYNYAYKVLYNKEPDYVLYASIPHKKLIKFNYNKDLTNLVINDIIPSMVKGIKSGIYMRNGVFNNKCFLCDYKKDCLGVDYELDN